MLTSSQNTATTKVKMSSSKKKKLSKKLIFCLSLEALEFYEGLEGFFQYSIEYLWPNLTTYTYSDVNRLLR